MANPKALREERAALDLKINNLIDSVEKESRDFNAEETAQYEAMVADMKSFTARIQRAEEAEARAAEFAVEQSSAAPGLRNALQHANGVERQDGAVKIGNAEDQATALQGWLLNGSRQFSNQATDQHRVAAAKCGIDINAGEIRFGLNPNYNAVRTEIRNALSGLTGSAGGVTIPESFSNQFERAKLQFGGILNLATVMRTTTGEPFRWPTANDTSNKGRQINESVASLSDASITSEMTFAQAVWYNYKFTSDIVLVPFELLRDSAINLASELGSMLGERLGRIGADKFATGTGAGTVQGATVGASLGVTAASATAVTWDEIIGLEHSVDPAYRSNRCSYVLCDSSVATLRKLKNGQGNYLWQNSANSGTPDTLNGYKFLVDQSMPSIATGNRSILFGDFSYYKIREVNGVRLYRLPELYRANDQDGFVAFQEFDAKMLDAGTHPVKYILQP